MENIMNIQAFLIQNKDFLLFLVLLYIILNFKKIFSLFTGIFAIPVYKYSFTDKIEISFVTRSIMLAVMGAVTGYFMMKTTIYVFIFALIGIACSIIYEIIVNSVDK